MTSAIAPVGLRFDSVDLQPSDLQFQLVIAHGLNEPPSVRGTDVVVPALAGRIEANRINDVLPIELVGFCTCDPAGATAADQMASFRANARDLRSLFATNRARAVLEATLEDGTVLEISARPLNSVWTELIPSIYADLSIELEAYDDWSESGS